MSDRDLKSPSWSDRVNQVRAFEVLEKYRKRLTHDETGLPFEPTRKRGPLTVERLAFETRGVMRLALNVFFPICAAIFAVSFLWDWHGIIRSCSVAGMIGFGTNWVAIKMLFWPRQTRPVFGQGLIPSQRDQLIEKVADEVLSNLINEELILAKIEETKIVQRLTSASIDKLRAAAQEPDFKDDIRDMVLTYVAEVTSGPEFRDRLVLRAEQTLEDVAGQRFSGWLVRKLKDMWRAPLVTAINREIERLPDTMEGGLEHLDEIMERLPAALEERQESIDQVLTTMQIGLVREVDVRAIVLEQLSSITTEQLERGFREFSDDKLSYITLLGGMLGLVGGVVIVWPIPAIVGLLGLFGLLVLLDLALYPLMKSRYYPKQ
jgi:hypothetical protein